jgi:hypothetical protein
MGDVLEKDVAYRKREWTLMPFGTIFVALLALIFSLAFG